MTTAREYHYAIWRMDMWVKDYGSYQVIDRAVRMGILKPFMNYPERKRRRGLSYSEWKETMKP